MVLEVSFILLSEIRPSVRTSSAYIFTHYGCPVLVGELLLSITLIPYALHSPVMQWELGITMPYGLGFTDFTGFKDADSMILSFCCVH